MPGGENRAPYFEGLQVFVLVVGGVLLPALIEDADPFVSQRPNDGVLPIAAWSGYRHVPVRPLPGFTG